MTDDDRTWAEAFRVSEDEREWLGRKEWAICVATFYEDLADRLVSGAIEGFAEGGVTLASIQTYKVPGAFELPVRRQGLRGRRACSPESPASAPSSAARPPTSTTCAPRPPAASRMSGLTSGVPAAFGVITCDTREQAEARAGGDKRDQGRHAAYAVMSAALVRKKVLG